MLLSVTAGISITSQAIGQYGVDLNSAGYNSQNIYKNRPQCTWYCWGRAYEKLGVSLPKWGNAISWDDNADADPNYTVGTVARANSIMVENDTSGDGHGHVMFVEKVENGYAYITEGNWLSSDYHEDRINLSTMVRDSWTSHTLSPVRYIYLTGGSPIGGGAQTVSDGEYHIVSALNRNMGLDAEDGKTANDTNICLYNNIEDSTQTFILKYLGDGFYSIIHKKSQKSLDVNMASTANGTNVKLYTYSGNDAQRWVVQTSGDGYFYIKSKCNGLCVDVTNASTSNKSNIQMYSGNNSNAQKWAFIAANGTQSVPNGNYHIVSALNNNYGLDVYGCENKNGTNVQLFNNKSDANQVFNINCDKKGYYTITHNKTSKVLDMYNNGTYFGTNVNIYAANGTDAQKWIIKSDGKGYYYIIAKNSGLFIDVKDGKAENYNNVWGYIGNGSNAQKWKFICVNHTWNSGVTTKKATCTTTGTKLYTCAVCGEEKLETIKAKGHTTVIDKAVPETCEIDGKTEGSHCSVCGEILVAQKTVKAKGHTEVIDEAIPATFKTAGKTGGKHCSTCGKVLVAQKTVAKLGSPSLSKVTAGKKQFKATWKSVKNIDGYQIQYSTSSSFKSGNKTVTVSGYKSTSKTVKSLKAKKKYYVRIRGYKTINGKKQYSAWSKSKTVTTKK